MDVNKILMKTDSLENYTTISKNLTTKNKNFKIQLNMSTVLSLKKARDFEIEYFIECNGHGAATIIFERLLGVGRSKTWGLLGKELVYLLQHWLNSTRKHLIIVHKNWWSFMNLLLKFIKELRLKDSALPDLLVESTAEHLLDLATRSKVDVCQQLDILYCLNLCCADSGREVRFATRHHLESYFVKLSAALSVSGHVPLQRCMLETLLRWLLPRHNASVRMAAAARWFPDHLYSKEAVDVFLGRPWQDFYLDARDFLNVHNKTRGGPVSVVCARLTLHTLQWTPKRDAWLDINPSTKSLTVLLGPRAASDLGLPAGDHYTLVISDDVISDIKLTRVSSEVTLSINTSRPPHVFPSEVAVGVAGEIQVEVASGSDLKRLDNSLREVFGGKYEVLIDLDEVAASPTPNKNTNIVNSSEEDTRFSHPVRPPRRRASGYVIKSASTWRSPSTTSTTSLALLHGRLEALPKFRFNKEPVKVAAHPDLSIVSEVTEIVDSQSIASGTTSNRPYRGGFKSIKRSEKQSQSDGEACRSKKYLSPIVATEHNPSCLLVATIGSDDSVLNETIQSLSKNNRGNESNIVDLLLKEALQSKDNKIDSGFDTSENRKSPEFRDSDAIEDTPNVEPKSLRNKKVTTTKGDESEECNEIDESQFAFVSVRKKVLIDKHKEMEDDIQNGIEVNTFDEDAVEKFFSEHIAEDRAGSIVVSPTLARKINETSSEGDDFQDDFTCAENIQDNFANADNIEDVAIIDCLNDIIDKVCLDIGKCADILGRDNSGIDSEIMAETKEVEHTDDSNRVLTNIENIDLENRVVETPKKKRKQKKVIKLKFKSKKPLGKTRFQKQTLANKMSPIPESKDSIESQALEKNCIEPQAIEETEINQEVCKTADNIPDKVVPAQPKENDDVIPDTSYISPKSVDSNAPLLRRRRKLYSPKEEHNKAESQMDKSEKSESEVHYLQDDDGADFKSDSKNAPKYAATSYKDIEKTRKRQIRLPRSRKSKGKTQVGSPPSKNKHPFDRLKANVEEHVDIILADNKKPLSPRTIKMNEVFDNLKTNVEKHDIILADKKFNEEELAVFNFTSDSEDEDFKKKIVEIKKRISTTTNASGDSALSRHGRVINKINYSEKSSDEKPKNTKTKTVKRTKTRQRRPHNLADEKMREAQKENINTSLIVKDDDVVLKDPEPKLDAPLQMEAIDGETDEPVAKALRPNKGGRKKKVADKKKTPIIDNKPDNDDRTLSPLPGLVIEKMPPRKDDANDSVCTQVMDKLKKIYREGPDAIDESNTTQNLLLDIEKVDFNQHQYISEDFCRMSPNIPDVMQNNSSDIKSNTRRNNAILNEDENVIEVINYDEETNKAYDENSKAKSKKKDIVIIYDVPSEKSIATVGKSPINAHGDVDEDPPDKNLLIKNVQSRNLDIEEMETSIKDYYMQLRKEINKPDTSGSSSNVEIDLMRKIQENKSKCISPVVQIHEKSDDNNLKWLQIKNATIIDLDDNSVNSSNKAPVVSLKRIPKDDLLKYSAKKRNNTEKSKIDLLSVSSNGSRKCISPVVSLTKMSYDDISKWLPSRRNSSELSNSEKSRKIEVYKDLPEKSLARPNLNIKTEVIASSLTNSSKRTEKPSKLKAKTNTKTNYNLRAKSSSSNKIDDQIDCNNNDHNTVRKSVISPIKLFDDILLAENTDLTTATPKKVAEETNKCIKSPILNISASKKLDFKKSTIISSDSNISCSTRLDGKVSVNTLKRKSPSPVRVYDKRYKVQELTDSGPSLSSVDEWLKRSASFSAAQNLTDCYAESLQNIMEKLDTTLVEIHQNTSKNFLHLFVEAQRHLSEAKIERRRAMKLVASEVLREVLSVLDRKFEDLDKRTQEMDSEFMEQLKSRAAEFIREDCKKKRVLVELLRDDITAALRHKQSQDTKH